MHFAPGTPQRPNPPASSTESDLMSLIASAAEGTILSIRQHLCEEQNARVLLLKNGCRRRDCIKKCEPVKESFWEAILSFEILFEEVLNAEDGVDFPRLDN